MTSTASETATQVTSKPEVSLDDRIAKVCHAACRVDGAFDDLVRALHALDDEDIPASVRDLAFGMHHAAEQLRDISDRVDRLEALADEAAEDDDGSRVMSNTVTRLQKVVSTRGDGRFEASLRCIYEDDSYREFVTGVSADLDDATAMAVALEAKLWAPHTG